MATAGESESKGKRNWGRDRGRTATFVHRRPPAALISASSFFFQESGSGAAHTQPFSNQTSQGRATYATWSNLVPGGRERELSTCTCGCSGRPGFFFFFFPLSSPLPRVPFPESLANNQQVGRCLPPLDRRGRKVQCIIVSS